MNHNRNAFSLLDGLFLLFLGLKLGTVIDWSWWWVFAPLWVPYTLSLLVAFLTGAAKGVANALKKHEKARK